MRSATKIKLVALLSFAIAFITGIEGYTETQRLAHIEKNGVTVDGVIEIAEIIRQKRRRKTVSSDQVKVTYARVGGKPVTESFEVNPEFYHSRVKEGIIIDPMVKVRYVPSPYPSPIIVGGSTDRAMLLWVGIAFAGVGILLLVLGFRTRS